MQPTNQSRHPAAPANMFPVRVVRREVVAREVISLFVAAPDGRRAPAHYLPGQFVTLAFRSEQGMVYRSYSLCGVGRADEPWEITIKRMRKGVVSRFLYDSAKVGTWLYASSPRGSFTLPQPLRTDVPLIFVAAGSGVTPIRGMLRAMAALPAHRRPQAQLHYASRAPEDIIYLLEWERIDPTQSWLRQWHYLSSTGARMTAAEILARAGSAAGQAHWFMCGPEDLRRDLFAQLTARGVPPERVHFEAFAAAQAPTPHGGSRPIALGHRGKPVAQMRVQDTGATLDVLGGETLLTALERHGYRPDFSCRTGSCGTCKLRVLAGNVSPKGTPVLTAAERAAGYVLSCVAQPLSDVTLASGGQPPVPGASRRPPGANRIVARATLQIACLAAVGGLMLLVWPLTNHKPARNGVSVPPPTAPVTGTGSQAPTPTDTAIPTPTATPNSGGGVVPTTTPAPFNTPTPIPIPTATPVPIPPPAPTVVAGQS